MPGEMPQAKFEKPKDVVNLVYTVASIHVACITPLLRSGFGTHAFAGYPLALILMLVYAVAAHCELLAWYIPVWMLLIAMHRLTADPTQYSRYQGYPFVFGWMVNEQVARISEMFICFFAALFLSMVSEPLAEFILAEIVSLLIVLSIETATWQARKRATRDAQIMAQHMSELHRGGSGW